MVERILLIDSTESEKPLSLRGVALAGTLASITAAFLVCRVPHASPHSLTALALLLLSLKYMAITLAWGIAATWIYFRRSTAHPAAVFMALTHSLFFAWILFPPFVLFLFEESPGLLIVAPAATAALAICLQRYLAAEADSSPGTSRAETENTLFAELPPPAPGRLAAVLSSLSIYAAAISAIDGSIVKASIFLAICALLLMSRWMVAVMESPREAGRRQHSAGRTAGAVIAAILITWIALLPWLRSSHSTLGVYAADAAKNAPPKTQNAAGASADAWHAIVLWPFPPRKEQLRAPMLHSSPANAPAVSFVIPFDGEYRYYETPGIWIPARAHLSKGTPLEANIHSADWGPLLMEAHQQLAAPVDLSCCLRLQLSLRNGDNRRGRILVGVILSDGTIPGKPSLILEPQPVLSSEAGHGILKDTPDEVLRFDLPPQAKIRSFDEITVLFLPDPERAAFGSKIAIHQFTLIPR
jgi:hypothetical protein